MDQRNATNGDSTGPVCPTGWLSSAATTRCGARSMSFIANGPPMQLPKKKNWRMAEMVHHAELVVGEGVPRIVDRHRPEQPDYMYNSGKDVWAKEFRERRPDVSMAIIEAYLHSLYRVRPDFVYSVSRDFAKSCQTPMLVLPDDVTAHPLQVSIDIASLAPNAEITVFPWKDPPELKARTINRACTFLKRHLPA
jgi:hypothetical protein